MSDHGIQRVDGLVGNQARKTEKKPPEERRGHAVRGILGQTFERRPGDAGLIQLFSIPSYNLGDLLARTAQITRVFGMSQAPSTQKELELERARSEKGPAENRQDHGAQHTFGQDGQYQSACQKAHHQDDQEGQDTIAPALSGPKTGTV